MQILKPYVTVGMKSLCIFTLTYAVICVIISLIITSQSIMSFYIGSAITALIITAFLYFYDLVERYSRHH